MSKDMDMPRGTDHPAPVPAVEPVDLEGIKRRADAATPGPWCRESTDDTDRDIALDYDIPGEGYPNLVATCYGDPKETPIDRKHAQKNAKFIAHARTDIPALLALVASQAAEIAGLRAVLRDVEWPNVPLLEPFCLFCWENKPGPHREDCRLAAVLGTPSPDPDNPAATEASERKQYAEACRAGEIARAGEGTNFDEAEGRLIGTLLPTVSSLVETMQQQAWRPTAWATWSKDQRGSPLGLADRMLNPEMEPARSDDEAAARLRVPIEVVSGINRAFFDQPTLRDDWVNGGAGWGQLLRESLKNVNIPVPYIHDAG